MNCNPLAANAASCVSAPRNSRFGIRRHPIVLALTALVGSQAGVVDLSAHAIAHRAHADTTTALQPMPGPRAPTTWTVKNCDDSGTDSLRAILQDPMLATGDIVDLGQLPTLCSMRDSVITLTSGELVVAQDDLTLFGPCTTDGSVTISGGDASRVLRHNGIGTLAIHRLKISNGYIHAPSWNVSGGCIVSAGNVSANQTTVKDCKAVSDWAYASGGGIYAANEVTLTLSTISGNEATAPMEGSYGGGISARRLTAKYSSLTGNTATAGAMGASGGGAYVFEGMSLLASTIDNNAATWGGALNCICAASSVSIANSTISSNISAVGSALDIYGDSLAISNSTVAFNHSNATASTAGVSFIGPAPTSMLTLESSIIANNTAGSGNVPADLEVPNGYGLLSGADNLVVAALVASPPLGVIVSTSDPKLGLLQFNGGLTRTRALLAGSPAIGAGNNYAMRQYDQRGYGYPRSTGPNARVDIGAFQFDSIFVSGLEW